MTANNSSSPEIPAPPRYTGWLVFLSAAALQSLAAMLWLALIPGDPKNGLLLGFSASRLGLMAAALLAAAFFALGVPLMMRSVKFRSLLAGLAGDNRKGFLALCALLAVSLMIGWGFLVGLRGEPGEATFAIFERLTPVLTLVCAISAEGLTWLMIFRFGLHGEAFSEFKDPIKIALWSLVGAIVIGIVLAITGYGIIPDEFFWGSPGVPLLSWQVVSSALLAVLAFAYFKLTRPATWKTDVALFLLFWVGAYLLWMGQPVQRSFFTPGPRAPNFEVYPYSDAGFYDYVSQSLLTGNGFLNHQIITRPLYAVLLAGFHALVGQSYSGMIALQTVVLALFPALLYLLGKTLHSREAGILTAALAIWREMNLMAATPFTEVSNSKMLLTDSLTGVAFAGFILWLVWWQKQKRVSPGAALGLGGLFGLMLLLRAQALVVLPVVMILVLLNQRRALRRGLAGVSLMVLGTLLSFSPWLWRNYQLTHTLVIDQPSQAAISASRFALSLDTVDTTLSSKSPQEVTASVARFVMANPLYTARFVGAHFLNNEFSTLTILPLRVSLIDPRDNLLIATPFWLTGIQGLTAGQFSLLIFNLIAMSAGLAFAFWRWGWTGLMPFFVHLAYSFSSAMARISGWRFVQPVDWVGYLYFAIGLACLFALGWRIFGGRVEKYSTAISEVPPAPGDKWPWPRLASLAALAVGLVLLGSITPAMETLIPPRYAVIEKSTLFEKIGSDPLVSKNARISAGLMALSSDPGSVALWGRALYPRYYKVNQGEPGSGWTAYKAKDFARLGFVLITSTGMHQVILPAEESPATFPNGSDVLLAGCNKDGLIEAALVLVGSGDNALYLSSQASPFECK